LEKCDIKNGCKKTPQERVRFAFSMFSDARRIVLASMPKDLSAAQKRYIYERTYGEKLTEDFFSQR
jgi:predicted Fe-S protein YdhL (DUF1289 family)